jgi:hypothetical protein
MIEIGIQNDQNKGGRMRLICIFFILTIFSYGQSEGRYELKNSKELSIFFPKSDYDYIDYLVEKDSIDSHFQLAEIYLKNGNSERSKYYLDLYLKEENDPRKLLNYYSIQKDYEKMEEVLDSIIENTDDTKALQYKKDIYNEIQNKGLPLHEEKYRVDKVEDFFSYIGKGDELRDFFNSNQWTMDEIKKVIEKLKRFDLKDGTASKKLFDMFATKREKIENQYYNIKGIEDERGYSDYFDFAIRGNMVPEIKSPFEKLIYLKYKKSMDEYNKMEKEIENKALKEEDNSSLYTLWKVTKNIKILEFLKTQSEEYHEVYLGNLLANKNDELFYSEAVKFLDIYPKSYHRDYVLEKLFSKSDDGQTDELLKRYAGLYSRICKRERIKAAQGDLKIALMKEEILKGDKSYIEAFLKEMEDLYPSDEIQERLLILDDGATYAQYLIQQGMDVPEIYKADIAYYLYGQEKLEELIPYVKYLGDEELKVLSEKDMRYKKEYVRRNPLADENIDSSQERYIYFSENPNLDPEKVKDLEKKSFMEPHEKYYAALYYNKKGEYLKSYRLIGDVSRRYSLSEKIINLYNENIHAIKQSEAKKEDE